MLMDLVTVLRSHFFPQARPYALLFVFFILHQNKQELLSLLLQNSFHDKYHI